MKSRDIIRWLQIASIVLGVLLVVAAGVVSRMWQDRPDIQDIGWSTAATKTDRDVAVTATWLGISTILFDDGETQILIDGTMTRVSPLSIALSLPLSSDVATINYALTTYRVDRLAAIIPTHSHFDHAMDIGYVANRTTALVLGSDSTANIARGANVPVNQYQTLASGETREFGEFRIRLLASAHAPIGPGDEEWFPGTIDEPLVQPARPSAWKTGVAWSILIEHPRGTSLIQGSGGFVPGALQSEAADVVMLGIGGLSGLGKDYIEELWDETVIAPGAARVIAIHHDDYTAPFGEVRLFPRIVDDAVRTAGWIEDYNNLQERVVSLELPPFGQPVSLY
jgi:L-ascorbate metabolism protein UlaG (beta-lactamase superfamily)